VDDRALATSLAEGHLDGLLAVYDGYADRLFGYGFGLLGSEDAAIGGIRDALLIAHEQAATLADPTRLKPWLYALTRNECVRRRRHAGGDDLDSELASLTLRHRLAPDEIADIVGLSADETTHRLRSVIAGAPADDEPADDVPAPAALLAQLTEGVAPDAAEYRAALVRRAGPFDGSGFPRPLDQRRITGGVLAWSTAAAVLLALALLVVLPGNGSSAGVPALAALPGKLPAAGAEPAAPPQPSFTSRDAWPLPAAASLRPVGQPEHVDEAATDPADSRAAPPRPAPAATSSGSTKPNDRRPTDGEGGGVISWYQNQTAPDCDSTWTARLHAVVAGVDPAQVASVGARWSAGRRPHPVDLRRSGQEWVGTVSGLPTGREAAVVLWASTTDGRTLTGNSLVLLYRCS
jgi:DNA-directed RNA polymerase specialized sigma24 family protein